MFAMLDPNRSPIARSGASDAAAAMSVAEFRKRRRDRDEERPDEDPSEAGVLGDLVPDARQERTGDDDDHDRGAEHDQQNRDVEISHQRRVEW